MPSAFTIVGIIFFSIAILFSSLVSEQMKWQFTQSLYISRKKKITIQGNKKKKNDFGIFSRAT